LTWGEGRTGRGYGYAIGMQDVEIYALDSTNKATNCPINDLNPGVAVGIQYDGVSG